MTDSAPRRDAPGSDRPSWSVLGIHHVAFASADGGPAEALASVLGLDCSHAEAGDGFDEAMIPVGSTSLQVLTATGPGIVQQFLDRRGPGLHHVAFRVDDIDAATRDLCARDIAMVDRAPRPGGGGTRIAFAHPKAFGGMLVEFVEEDE